MRLGEVRTVPGRTVVIAGFPEVLQAGGLPYGILEPVADLVLEPPVLIENERGTAEDLDAHPARHVRRRVDVDSRLQLVDVQGSIWTYSAMVSWRMNPSGPDAVAGPDVLDLHIAILGDLERNTVLPDEPEHLFLVAQHRIEMAAVVEELPLACAPCAVGIGSFRDTDIELREVPESEFR